MVVPDPPLPNPPPEEDLVFGAFRLIREIGRGGMGTVYLAEVLDLPFDTSGDASTEIGDIVNRPAPGTRVAVKTFHPHLVETKDFARRFRREARTGAAIRHENVVRTYEAGSAKLRGTPTSYMVMEYVEGQTLRELIKELGQVPVEFARQIARQVAAGVQAIHAAGVTHRDLKPENVIITSDHRVKLMDLGVAKLREASIRLSMTGQFLGSVHYASPEQFRNPESVDPRTDLYALGVLVYEMLCGQNPFFHSDIRVVLRRTVSEMPRRLSLVVPDAPPFLDELTWTLVQKDPAARLQTAAEVADVLEHGEESAWWTSQGKSRWTQAGGRLSRRLPVQRETRVVGREAELATLRRLFELAAGGERQTLLLEGEAGVGKTRLLDEAAAALAEEGASFHFLFGAAAQSGTGRPFHSFAEALLGALDPADVAGSLAALLPADAPAAAFADLLTGAPGAPALSQDQVRALFAASFRALAAQKPLLLVLDDVHLASENTLNLLAYLARDDRSARILMAAAFRPPEEGQPLHQIAHGTREGNVHCIVLPRLAPKDIGALLREVLRSERLVQELGFRLMEKTGGNPFFLLEVLRSLQQDRVLTRRDDGVWTLVGTKLDIHVPDSVKELLHTNLARLSDEDRDLLDVAAVMGMEFDPEVLSEVLGVPKIPLLKRLSQLERKRRLIRSVGRKCRFDHHQLRETLYSELMEGLRDEYHAQVGQCLERRRGAQAGPAEGAAALDLAHHFVLGGRTETSLRYVVPALRHAAATYKTEEGTRVAVRFLEIADATAPADVRVEVMLALAAFHEHEGRRVEEREVLDRAADAVKSCSDARLARRVAERRLVAHFRLGRFEQAAAVCLEAFELAERDGDRDAAIAALGNLAGANRSLGRYDEAAAALQRALSEKLPAESRLRRCLLLGALGMVECQRGRRRQAQIHFLEAVRVAQAFGIRASGNLSASHPPDDTMREQFAGLARALGRYAESRIDGERMLLVDSTLPQRLQEAAALLSIGVLASHLDMLADARGCLLGALDACREGGDLRFEAAVLHALGENALAARDGEQSRRDFVAALEIRRKIAYRPGVCETLLALGQIATMEGDVEAARTFLEEATELAPALDLPAIAALARATAAMLYAKEGRRDRARAELEAARLALADAGPMSVSSRAEGLYFAALAARALGDAEAAHSHMQAAWRTVREIADRMPPAERAAFLATSPNKEIAADVEPRP